MKKSVIFWSVILMVGCLIVLYPTLSNYWNAQHQSQLIADYVSSTQALSHKDSQLMLEAANQYNQQLKVAHDPDLTLTDSETEAYQQQLDITNTGIMGYIEIPKVHERLPIYHGTDEEILQVAIGHLAGTSLPVGGKGTHAVISGHRGLPSAKLFTNIDKLRVNDTFTITSLNRTLTYQVDHIATVLPDDVSLLRIEEGKDLVTLVTCTPYGVNTHRLLVRGHRIKTATPTATRGSQKPSKLNLWLLLASAIGLSLILVGTWRWRRRSKA
ncbi:class C sortase [Streptococcus equi]|uniref:class C sortase n=1 Tax=Streptococcus equi TaxID=1336 RepID=UPI0024A9D960|nr:class C sortase [Streptococcus equi]MDI6043643.1 class C sortase [Streptococcus equi subsp. zooepidemicus]WKF67206.1 class C sortase [Streptococcus equi subsp. zooepidemicus]HEL0023781.1 class C sortase [Streptococcus equi subsp. zooepidemicus]HEL1116508.1 class C sortase [Streptococcus equi subsp. zooepidemicus]HEL1170103.1 class C sortase [Streptococcus equi subsp. zooepidemicus]